MRQYKRVRTIAYILLLHMVFLFTGCSSNVETQIENSPQVSEEPTTEKNSALADSLDEAVVIGVDTKNEELHLQNIETGKTYTLEYSSATSVEDKNGKQLVMGQLEEGTLVTLTFIHEKKLAKQVFVREEAQKIEEVVNFEINKASHTMEFSGERYSIDENVAVVSDSEKKELIDINEVDQLTVWAVDHTIYSIQITKGHGYLRLSGYEPFIEGWIEVGQSLIKPITESMLLVVPEGEYSVHIYKDDMGGFKDVSILKNEENELDVSDLVVESETGEDQVGKIVFSINPTNATLLIDGTEVDYSDVVLLSYGVHQLVCKAEGYATMSKYIKVSQENANIDINLEKGSDKTQSVSENSTEKEKDVTTASSNYKVYIDAPDSAEVYVDGKYIGLIPTSFPKVAGTYTVSIRKTGYQTRSYSLEIDNIDKDVNFSFSELTESRSNQTTTEVENVKKNARLYTKAKKKL